MLVDSRFRMGDKPVELDAIHNYYENLVFEQVFKTVEDNDDLELIADVACVALNHLPPRYIRHEVDMAFFLPQLERIQMEKEVEEAVEQGIKILDERESREKTA